MSKLAGKNNRDLTPYEKKCKKDTIVFVGDSCVTNALDFCLRKKERREKKHEIKILEHNLHLHAHNGSRYDTWIVLKNLLCDKRIVNNIKKGKGIIEIKLFSGCIQKNRKQISSISAF